MTHPYAVRPATQADVDRVAELWAEFVDFHAGFDARFERANGSEEGFAEHLRNKVGEPDFLLLVAEVDGRVVGYLDGEVLQYPPSFKRRMHGFLTNLAVGPDHQRGGIGRALLDEGMEWFRAKGVKTVEMKVLMANPVAMSFWQKSEFEPYMQIMRASTNPPESPEP